MTLRRSTRWWLVVLLVVVVPLVVLGVHALTSDRHTASRALGPVAGGERSAAGAPGDASSGPAHPSTPASHDVVALGDSVPSGHACDCRPFPLVYATLLSRRTGARVTEDNRAVSGLDTGGLVSQLRDPSVRNAVRRADIVLVTIGANDFQDHHDQVVYGRCWTGSTDCVSDELRTMGDRLATALATIRSLRAGRPTTVLVTGYWNVFQDGDVARRAFGESGLQASLRLTLRANALIRSTTTNAGARYVDIFTPFERPGQDITSLLAADGDHPDAAGHDLIARALLRAGLPRMG